MDNIESVDDQEKLLIKNSIKYLHSLTNIRGINCPTVKSLYRTKCRLMELRRHIFLNINLRPQRCDRCFLDNTDRLPKCEIKPFKLTRYAKKVIAKVNGNKILTEYQKQYYKKLQQKCPNVLQRQNQNQLVKICSYCKKESVILMNKPYYYIRKEKACAPKKPRKKKVKVQTLLETITHQLHKKNKPATMQNSKENNILKNLENKNTNKNNSNTRPTKNKLKLPIMTNERFFATSDFIPLENSPKNKTSKSCDKNTELEKPKLQTTSKFKEKKLKKNLNTLSEMLKKAKVKKNKEPSKLKVFLANL